MSQPQNEAPKKARPQFANDFLASIVVFLVALPLCMGIAIASGAPVSAGIITGIVGGIVVGVLAGCPLQVSGPAAGLTIIVYDTIQQYGLESLGIVVLLAGAVQMTAGLLKLGQWFRAVSPAVIHGMLAGIGLLILGSQFHVMIDDKPHGSGAENLASIPSAIWKSAELPSLSTRDVREFRTHALREVGELHRSQANLHEHVSELAPYHTHTPRKSDKEAAQSLQAVTMEQADLLARLTAVTEQLREFQTASASPAPVPKSLAAAERALAHNEQALAALQAGDVNESLAAQASAVGSLESLLASFKSHHLAAYLGTLTILIILLWQAFAPGRLKLVPAPLIAVLIAAGLATALALPVFYVEVPSNLLTEIHFPVLTAAGIPWWGLIQAALLMAVVASAETLLCAAAVDQIQSESPPTNFDRELFAQGIGNTICGLVGALPMTGVIVRSSANVLAGGKTRVSAILHGVWLLLFVALLGFALRMIPTGALAAILVYTGFKLVNFKVVRELRRYGWGEVAIYVATVATIVLVDLLTGVLVGVGLSAAKLLYTFAKMSARVHVINGGQSATLNLSGVATFVRLPHLAAQLQQVPAGSALHVTFAQLDYIDHACLDLLTNWARRHESTGGTLSLDWKRLHACFHRSNGTGIGDENNNSQSHRTADVAHDRAETVAGELHETHA
jgi:MFS superfamily sulfate permease-like transporter